MRREEHPHDVRRRLFRGRVVQRQVAVPVRHARLPVVALEEEREDLVRPIGLVGQQRVQGFSLFFQAIAMHAVSRDTSDFPHACLYVQLDAEHSLRVKWENVLL